MNGSQSLDNSIAPWRIAISVIVIALAFAIYIWRLFSLQVLESDLWVAKAEENSILTINLPALRGIIYDRNGIVLARNIALYNVVITSAYLPDDPGAVQDIYRQLSASKGVTVSPYSTI